MPVTGGAPAASVLALCIGLILVFGLRPAAPASVLPPAVAAATTTPVPHQTSVPIARAPTATPAAAIPDGYRIKIARLAIDLPIVEGDLEPEAVGLETPEYVALHLPGSALAG